MRFIEVVKRIVPFLAAMVIGMFVAGIFASFSTPVDSVEWKARKSAHGDNYRYKHKKKRCDRRKKRKHRRERREIRNIEVEFDTLIKEIPPPPPMAPEAPVAPLAPPPPPAPPAKAKQ